MKSYKYNLRHQIYQRRLLDWFKKYGRDLPWRKTVDPYKIHISEVMLQQTQVERVIKYYSSFLGKYPTILDLANASRAEVLFMWKGLGYYNRAVNLHKLAKIIVHEYNGKYPDTVNELLKLPGIGRYTAGAILCFGMRKDVAFIDTNIERVLTRLFVIRNHVSRSKQMSRLQNLADTLIPVGQAWPYNQALMDFGATVCQAVNPKCNICMFTDICVLYRKAHRSYQITVPELKAAETIEEYRL